MTQAATLSPDRVKKTLDTYYGGMSRLDIPASISAFAPDGVSESPKGSGAQRGRAAIESYFAGLAAALQSIAIAPTAVHPSADGVAVQWQASWKGRNGRSGTFTGIDAITLDGSGQISELIGYWDAGTVLGEMGAA